MWRLDTLRTGAAGRSCYSQRSTSELDVSLMLLPLALRAFVDSRIFGGTQQMAWRSVVNWVRLVPKQSNVFGQGK